MAKNSCPCQECGQPFRPRQLRAAFCSTGCRTAFNHRRRNRGAELYDLYMHAKTSGSKDDMDAVKRLTNEYIVADKAKRSGRKSWQPIQYAMIAMPVVYGREGDGR